MDSIALGICLVFLSLLLLVPPSLGSRQDAVRRFVTVVGVGVAVALLFFLVLVVTRG